MHSKEKKKTAVATGIGALFSTFIGILILIASFTAKSFFNKNTATIFFIAFVISLIVGAIVFFIELQTKMPFTAAQLLKKNKGLAGAGMLYVPTDTKLYMSKNKTHPDLKIFTSKTGLKTQVGFIIFTRFIATELGDHIVDTMLLQQQAAETKQTIQNQKAKEIENNSVPEKISAPSTNETIAKMKGWIFSCYDHDRVQAMSMFSNMHDFYSEGNIIKTVREWMKLTQETVTLQYIPSPNWNAPNVKATENSFDCNIDIIYSKVIDYLTSNNLCTCTQAVGAVKQNMPYPKPGLLLVIFLIDN